MFLIVHEFKSNWQSGKLFQEIKIDSSKHLHTIRTHLIRVGVPVGTVTMKIYDENDLLLVSSAAKTISEIGTGTYWHGYWPFEVRIPLPAGIYKVYLEVSGYTFGGSDYLGWCNDYDLQKYPRNYTVNGDIKAPMDMEFWTFQWRDYMRILDFDDGFESNTQPTISDLALQQFIFEPVVNNQVSVADVTDMLADATDYHKVHFHVRVYRITSTTEKACTVDIFCEYKPTLAQWIIERAEYNEDAGVTFSIVAATGQIQYVSTNMGGTGHTGYIKWIETSFERE